MNIAEFSIKKSVITWTMTFVLVILGYYSYLGLPRLEDPEFAIKDAVNLTPYPGASLSARARRMWKTTGFSVKIKDKYDKSALPQIWDELRRKINDHQKLLPPGSGPPIVNDDFGDVYGAYYALHGKGYTYAELKKVAEMLKRELLTVTDVKKIVFFGEQTEAIYVEISKSKMAALGISGEEIFNALQQGRQTDLSQGRRHCPKGLQGPAWQDSTIQWRTCHRYRHFHHHGG